MSHYPEIRSVRDANKVLEAFGVKTLFDPGSQCAKCEGSLGANPVPDPGDGRLICAVCAAKAEAA